MVMNAQATAVDALRRAMGMVEAPIEPEEDTADAAAAFAIKEAPDGGCTVASTVVAIEPPEDAPRECTGGCTVASGAEGTVLDCTGSNAGNTGLEPAATPPEAPNNIAMAPTPQRRSLREQQRSVAFSQPQLAFLRDEAGRLRISSAELIRRAIDSFREQRS
jgi:hypothetical protein